MNRDLNEEKFRYKRASPSHIRHNLISILIKSCSARGRSDVLPKELQNKTSTLNFLLELAMQLRKYI